MLAVAETGKETRFSPRPFSRSCIFLEHDGTSILVLSAKQNIVRVIDFSIAKAVKQGQHQL